MSRLKPGSGAVSFYMGIKENLKSFTVITLYGYGFYDPITQQLNDDLRLPSLSKRQVPRLERSTLLRKAYYRDKAWEWNEVLRLQCA